MREVNISIEELDKVLDEIVYTTKSVSVSRLKEIILRSILEAGKDKQKRWLDSIKKALSDKLPVYMLHKKRYPRDRLFPYLVSGELKDSVYTDIKKLNSDDNVIIVEWWFGFKSSHANYTTFKYGQPTPKWAGWGVRQLSGEGTRFIPSARNLVLGFVKSKLKSILEGRR